MVTLSFTIFSGQKNYNRAHMLFQVLCGFEPIFYTTHPNEESIILLIADHMDWRDEYQHLVMLQEKINVYITFLEQKQYEDIYKGENITYGIIEIHFLYNLTANAEKFLQSVQNQVAELGVKIQYCVSQEGADEAR